MGRSGCVESHGGLRCCAHGTLGLGIDLATLKGDAGNSISGVIGPPRCGVRKTGGECGSRGGDAAAAAAEDFCRCGVATVVLVVRSPTSTGGGGRTGVEGDPDILP